MSSKQKIDHRAAVELREEARRVLDRMGEIEDSQTRRALARQAFDLVREAESLEPFCALTEGGSGEATIGGRGVTRRRDMLAPVS